MTAIRPQQERPRFGRLWFATPMSEGLRMLGDRDEWRCWLCGGDVPRVFVPDSDCAPSRDHVIPRSAGGGDDPANLRLAHRACNARMW